MRHSDPTDSGVRKQAAQARGDIEKGYTGDKVPGFDPAVAPLETDAEAAGTPQPVQLEEVPARDQSGTVAPHVNSSSQGTAMRPFEQGSGSTSVPRLWLLSIGLLLAVALAAVLLIQSS